MQTELRPRGDYPGAHHHVTNRGLAGRTVFEGRPDVRYFLAQLAWAVHERWLEVHAYSILTTHFHLLLTSTRGELSDALMRIEYRYVKRFNRLRDRDGSLFRSRFRSRLVDSDEYWLNVIRYIDANAVEAGLCATPGEHEFGSAQYYLTGRRNPWLERAQVERTVRRCCRAGEFRAEDYERVFGAGLDPEERWVLERRLEQGSPNDGGRGSGDELLRAAPEHVRRWLGSCTELADGGRTGLVLAAPARVRRVVGEAAGSDPDPVQDRRSLSCWPTIEAGLLRQLCGLTLQEISEAAGISRSGAWQRLVRHSQRLALDPGYGRRVEQVLQRMGGAAAAVGERPWRAGLFSEKP